MKNLAYVVLGLAVVIIVSNFRVPHTLAQRPANTVTIEPASLNFNMSGSSDKQVSMVTIHNDYDTDLRMSVKFKGIDETGGKIVPQGDPSAVILDTLKLGATEFGVPAHGVYFLTILATDNGTLPAGGHYGTLVLSDKTNQAGQSSIQTEVSLGIFIVKRDGLISKIELTSHLLARKYFTFPKSLSVELLNDGNAHEIPRGSAQVIDRRNNVLAEGVFNKDSRIILPGKRFNQQISLDKGKNSYLPQRLRLEIRYRADGMDEETTYQKYFWYVPAMYLYLAIAVSILAVIFMLRRKLKIDTKNKSKITTKIT